MHFEADRPLPRSRASHPTLPATPLALALQFDEVEIARAKDEQPSGRYSMIPGAALRDGR